MSALSQKLKAHDYPNWAVLLYGFGCALLNNFFLWVIR